LTKTNPPFHLYFTQENMESVLDIQQLTRQFGTFLAVDDLSFQVAEGSFFSILGPSGCGKTTLLRMIAGFLSPSSGKLQIRGQDMIGIPPNKRPVNLVFQNLALFPMMNVADNIAFGLKQKGVGRTEAKTKVAAMLERVGLGSFGDKKISQLSGGQKQRVAIARALVVEPSILLLDEPLGALDLKLREHMKIELKKLQSEVGTTFIYITHDQSEALVMSDTVAVMNRGRFEQVDSPRNLYEKPATGFVASFVGESNQFSCDITGHEGGLDVMLSAGLQFKARAMVDMAGNRCRMFIRPESVIIEPDGGLEKLNLLDLTVRTILFDGSNTKLLAGIDNTGLELTVALPQNRQFAHIRKGDRVKAGVHWDSCYCFAEGEVANG